MAKMRPFKERHPAMDISKVVAVQVDDEPSHGSATPPTQQVVLRLSRDVVASLRSRGRNLSAQADELLRSGLEQQGTSTDTVKA